MEMSIFKLNQVKLTVKKVSKIIKMVDDLGWEYQRMSSSGQETYEELCLLLGLDFNSEEEVI